MRTGEFDTAGKPETSPRHVVHAVASDVHEQMELKRRDTEILGELDQVFEISEEHLLNLDGMPWVYIH